MKIAQVAPLFESIPPERYGGTERVVYYLTEEFVRRGHDVTLFASGDSKTSARLVAPCPIALWRRDDDVILADAYHIILLEELYRDARQFDIIHFHFDYWHLPLATRSGVPFVTTLHGRLDLEDLEPLYRTFPDAPVVSISSAQRAPLPWLNWRRTIHHGYPRETGSFREEPGEYLAFIGRTSPEKGLDRAIEIAIASGEPLRISAAVQPSTREYFEAVIQPMLDHPLIDFVGELGGKEKEEFLARAKAVLFPINWPEPFGLVMIEAMAAGTPVIAFRRGSVAEVLRDGVSGIVVETVEDAVAAVGRIGDLDRRAIRRDFEERFSIERMADEYLDVYARLIEERKRSTLPDLSIPDREPDRPPQRISESPDQVRVISVATAPDGIPTSTVASGPFDAEEPAGEVTNGTSEAPEEIYIDDPDHRSPS